MAGTGLGGGSVRRMGIEVKASSSPTAGPLEPPRDLNAALRCLADEAVEKGAAPGIALLARNGREGAMAWAGVAEAASNLLLDDRSAFPLADLSRPLLCLVCLDLAREGRLDPEAPIETVLEELTPAKPRPLVSARHLMTEVAGWADPSYAELDDGDWEGMAWSLRRRRPAFAPGSVWSAGITGWILLAKLIERVTGRSAAAELQGRVFDPLGIVPIAAADGVRGHLRPGGSAPFLAPPLWRHDFLGLASSSAALSLEQFGQLGALLAGQVDHPLAALVPALRTSVIIPHRGAPVLGAPPVPEAAGLGLNRIGGFWGQTTTDNGFTGAVRFDPDSGAIAVVLLNTPNIAAREVTSLRLMAALGSGVHAQRPSAAPSDPSALTGSYRSLGAEGLSAVIDPVGRCTIDFVSGAVDYQLVSARDGALTLRPAAGPPMSIAAFVEGGATHLMIGTTAYKALGRA